MSPLRSILSAHLASGEQRPIRFFYGARTQADLFLLDEFAEIAAKTPDFKFIPALSHEQGADWAGERGFVHEVVGAPSERGVARRRDRCLFLRAAADDRRGDCRCLHMAGLEPEHIHFDKFTQPSR